MAPDTSFETNTSEDQPLVYGICVGSSPNVDELALPAIRARDPRSTVLERRAQSSIHTAYNSMIEEALDMDAAGLVLIHDDVSIRDAHIRDKLLALFADPTVGIVGVVGAQMTQSAEWWWYDKRGRVQEAERLLDFGRGTFEVEVLDGLMLALSPAALRHLRFDDQRYSGFHGYDIDICEQARSLGMRVMVADIEVFHNATPGRITDRKAYARTDRIWRSKWRRGLACDYRYRMAVVRSGTPPTQKLRRLLAR